MGDTYTWLLAGKAAAAGGQTGEAQAKAEVHKSDGNAAFQAGAYEEAVKAYSQAIEADPACAVYWSNRALAYLKVCLLLVLHSRGRSHQEWIMLSEGSSCLRNPAYVTAAVLYQSDVSQREIRTA